MNRIKLVSFVVTLALFVGIGLLVIKPSHKPAEAAKENEPPNGDVKVTEYYLPEQIKVNEYRLGSKWVYRYEFPDGVRCVETQRGLQCGGLNKQ